jgi:hypothetical protein
VKPFAVRRDHRSPFDPGQWLKATYLRPSSPQRLFASLLFLWFFTAQWCSALVDRVYTAPMAVVVNRISTVGTITAHLVSGTPYDISAGPDGALWFVLHNPDMVGRIATSGTITQFTIPTSGSTPAGIAAGSDGALWSTETRSGGLRRLRAQARCLRRCCLPADRYRSAIP